MHGLNHNISGIRTKTNKNKAMTELEILKLIERCMHPLYTELDKCNYKIKLLEEQLILKQTKPRLLTEAENFKRGKT
mgnify:FL=1